MSGCATGCGTCGVRLRSAGRLHHAETGELEVKRGDRVVIQLDRGQALGTVVTYDNGPKEAEGKPPAGGRHAVPLSRLLRKAKDEDLAREQRNEQRAKAAVRLAEEKLKRRRIDMRITKAEYWLDGSRVELFYLSEERHLPADLAQELSIELKAQVELYALGARDRVKVGGAVGVCGRETCCSSWMEDFHPVSVKMAKLQDFSLNENRLMGICGRLKCCLAYENPFYESVKKELPKLGAFVETEQGEGRVAYHHALRRSVTVRFEDGTQIELPVPEGGLPTARRRPQPAAPPTGSPAAAPAEVTAPVPAAVPAAQAAPEPVAVAPAPEIARERIAEPSAAAGLAEPIDEGGDEAEADGASVAEGPAGATGPGGERGEAGERRRRRRRRRRGGGGTGGAGGAPGGSAPGGGAPQS